MREPTVARPYVDIPTIRPETLQFQIDRNEVSLFDDSTGQIVYTTPCLTWGGTPGTLGVHAALLRARDWAKRHGFKVVCPPDIMWEAIRSPRGRRDS